MAKNRINIEVGAVGTEEAKAKLDQAAQATASVGETANTAGRKGADGMNELSDATSQSNKNLESIAGNATSFLTKMASVAAAIQLVTSVIEAQNQAIKEHGDLAISQTEALNRLQYLGALFEQKPELRNEVVAYSEYGRRSFEEVAGAYYNLRSKSGALSEETQQGIMIQALEMGRTDTQAPLDTLIDMFSLYAKKTGETDANRIQNVLLQTVNEAGGSIGDVANYMPQFLPVGMAGGLTGPQASGLWSYATTQTGSASVATTALRSVFMGLEGRGTPESQKLLKKFGIAPGMSFMDKIGKLGGIDLAGAEAIAGREGSAMLLDLANNPAAMNETIQSVVGVDRDGLDLTRDMLDSMMGTDERARLTDQIRYFEVRKANAEGGDIEALRFRRNDAAKAAVMAANGYDKTAIGQVFDYATEKVNMITRSFGYDIFDGAGPKTNININTAPTTIYARPGGDPTPRIGPKDVGAEQINSC